MATPFCVLVLVADPLLTDKETPLEFPSTNHLGLL
jgi:hypothetical protein